MLQVAFGIRIVRLVLAVLILIQTDEFEGLLHRMFGNPAGGVTALVAIMIVDLMCAGLDTCLHSKALHAPVRMVSEKTPLTNEKTTATAA